MKRYIMPNTDESQFFRKITQHLPEAEKKIISILCFFIEGNLEYYGDDMNNDGWFNVECRFYENKPFFIYFVKLIGLYGIHDDSEIIEALKNLVNKKIIELQINCANHKSFSDGLFSVRYRLVNESATQNKWLNVFDVAKPDELLTCNKYLFGVGGE